MTDHGDYEKSIPPEDVTPENPHVHALTAFTVIVTEDGKSYAILEPPPGVIVNYLPDATAVRRACHEIVDDINCQVSAEYAVQKQQKAQVEWEWRQKQASQPSFRVAERLADRAGRHAADAHLAHQFDDGSDDWQR